LSEAYKNAFNLNYINKLEGKLNIIEETLNVDLGTIDILTSELNELFLEPAKYVGIHAEKVLKVTRRKFTSKRKKNSKPWFNRECHILRAEYFRSKNKLHKKKSDIARKKLNVKAKHYKYFIRKTARTFYVNLHDKRQNLPIQKTTGK
jgi:hypothetical protein